MIFTLNGLPKKGKTAFATYYAVKHFKKQNNILVRFIKSIYKKEKSESFKDYVSNLINKTKVLNNNVYSNYPILLNKKHKIYSNIIKPDDLDMKYQLPKNSLIILDEFQRYYDSREYVKFPRGIGTFFQHHRHGDIKDIIIISQHPRRIDNKARDLCEVFRKMKVFIPLPLLPLVLIYYTDYYEFDDYGKYNHIKRDMRTYDYNNTFKIIKKSNIFGRYDSKYFKAIFAELPLFNDETFNGLELTKENMENIGIRI